MGAVTVLLLVVGFLCVAGVASADPMRTILSKEYKFPDVNHAEFGTLFNYTSTDDKKDTLIDENRELYAVDPYVRYSLTEDLEVNADIPFERVETTGRDETGIGDASVGVDLVAYKDIFDYPYIMPHATVTFDTGEKDKGLGGGDTYLTVGSVLGSTVEDIYHFGVDVTYAIHENSDNIGAVAGSLIWDLNKKCSLVAEGKITDERDKTQDIDHPKTILGGLWYKPTESFNIGFYGGSEIDGPQDVIADVKAAYSF